MYRDNIVFTFNKKTDLTWRLSFPFRLTYYVAFAIQITQILSSLLCFQLEYFLLIKHAIFELTKIVKDITMEVSSFESTVE